MLSKLIELSEPKESGITCVGVKFVDLLLRFAMDKKTLSATKEKVRNYIPDDIALFILSKLPHKSLKRFGCVRKSWSLLFENTCFMNMFRNNFISNLHCCPYYDGASLLLQLNESYYKVGVYSLSGERFENKVKLDFSNPFANLNNFRIFGFGSINGILCLYEYDHLGEIILLIPETQAIKILPSNHIDSVKWFIPDDAKDYVDVDIISHVHGFGYDHAINDIKVIRYVHFVIEPSMVYPGYIEEIMSLYWFGKISLGPLWEIYSLRSNSWRKVDVNMPSSSHCTEGTQVYLGGVCHWLSEKDEEENPDGPCLVSFYLSNEVFLVTPIPSDLDDCFEVEALWINLAVINDFIALISYHEQTTTFHISILGELGTKESWIKLFILGPLPCIERPIGVGTKGEILFERKYEELVWFDINTQTIEELGYKARGPSTRIIIYMENILPNGGRSS
jgi:molecular chaperone HtpG